jgi:NAD(P)H-hydrate repair Nnr-like enzyme with NAD(P)H-hydrate epimerase domain
VISVDINSGMNGDTGEGELTVVSDLTVSIGSVKQGLFKPQARARIGKLVNADIGIPVDWVNIDTLL